MLILICSKIMEQTLTQVAPGTCSQGTLVACCWPSSEVRNVTLKDIANSEVRFDQVSFNKFYHINYIHFHV